MQFVKSLLCCLFFILLSNSAIATTKHYPLTGHSLIGIIVPLPDESALFKAHIEHRKSVMIDGIQYYTGTINGEEIVFVNSGIGKVNAALISTRLIKDFHPDLIIMSGSSGNISTTVKKGDVVIGETVINADFGELTASGTAFQYSQYLLNPQTHTPLPLAFNLDERLLSAIHAVDAHRFPQMILGKIATSDALPNPSAQIQLLQAAHFDVVEMEGASLMQACWQFNTPCMVVRGVSNNAKEAFTTEDIATAADNAAKVSMGIIGAISAQ